MTDRTVSHGDRQGHDVGVHGEATEWEGNRVIARWGTAPQEPILVTAPFDGQPIGRHIHIGSHSLIATRMAMVSSSAWYLCEPTSMENLSMSSCAPWSVQTYIQTDRQTDMTMRCPL